jgi:hypothetical protein
LREVGTGNIIATLRPTESGATGGGLPVRSSYPEVLDFMAVLN